MNKKVFSLVLFMCMVFGICLTSCNFIENKEKETTTTQSSTTVNTTSDNDEKEEMIENQKGPKKTIIVYKTKSVGQSSFTRTNRFNFSSSKHNACCKSFNDFVIKCSSSILYINLIICHKSLLHIR